MAIATRRSVSANPITMEVKTTAWMWEDGAPLEHYCQFQHYLGVTGWTWGEFALLVNGRNFYRFPVKADGDFIKRIQDELSAWWLKHIIEKNEPPLSGPETVKIKALGVRVYFNGNTCSCCRVDDFDHVHGVGLARQQQPAGGVAEHGDKRVLHGPHNAGCHLRLRQVKMGVY